MRSSCRYSLEAHLSSALGQQGTKLSSNCSVPCKALALQVCRNFCK